MTASDIHAYNYQRAANREWRVSELLNKRVAIFIDDREVVVVAGMTNVGLGVRYSGLCGILPSRDRVTVMRVASRVIRWAAN